ncbi:MAG: hypothetical protein JWR25_1398 [Noviherbaspirillum sp.]|nr:hypothetical protein [Noviherbaspirillum sp.]
MRPYTLEDIIQPYKKYPKVIQNAILLAHTHPAFLALTRSTRKVLYALLTRASQHDGTLPIKARVDRLAAEAGVSEKTVQRAIASFREIGWLSQAEHRSEFGLFSSRQYCFSPALCELVRLPLTRSTDASLPQETKMSAGAIYVDLTFKEDQRKISVQQFKGKPVDLPDTLRNASQQFAIRATGIAKLRGIARAAGHELEHIIAVARSYLEKAGATGNRAYRYLESMALRPADYAGRVLQNERLAAARTKANEEQSEAERCRNKRFTGPAGLVVRVFDNAAEMSRDGVYSTIPYADLPRVYAMVKAGILKEAEPGRPLPFPAGHIAAARHDSGKQVKYASANRPAGGLLPQSTRSSDRPANSHLAHLARLRSIVGLGKRNGMSMDTSASEAAVGPA